MAKNGGRDLKDCENTFERSDGTEIARMHGRGRHIPEQLSFNSPNRAVMPRRTKLEIQWRHTSQSGHDGTSCSHIRP